MKKLILKIWDASGFAPFLLHFPVFFATFGGGILLFQSGLPKSKGFISNTWTLDHTWTCIGLGLFVFALGVVYFWELSKYQKKHP